MQLNAVQCLASAKGGRESRDFVPEVMPCPTPS